MSSSELQELLAIVKSRYPNNGILWLKDAASYFNVTLTSEVLLDLANPFSNRPLSLLTKVSGEGKTVSRFKWCP